VSIRKKCQRFWCSFRYVLYCLVS